MEYKISFFLNTEQSESLNRITNLFNSISGTTTPPEKMLQYIMDTGSAHDINNKLDFYEQYLAGQKSNI